MIKSNAAMAVLTALACAAAATLAGCASPQEVKAGDREKCAGYGFSAGSDAFANCMMQAEKTRDRKDEEWFRDQNRRIREEEAAKARR